MKLAAIAAGLLGIAVGSLINRIAVREPGYVITDPKDLPEGADPALLDELEPPPEDLPPVPVAALVRPSAWWRRWFPVTEIVVAASFAATVQRFGATLEVVVLLLAEAALLAIAVVDFRVYRIPDRINFPSMVAVFGLLSAVSLIRGVPGAIAAAAAGGVMYAGMLFLAHLVSPRGMGWGDVKLAWLMGFVLGWRGYDAGSVVERLVSPLRWVLLGAVFGSLLGVFSGGLYALVRRTTKVVFPYGPSLAAGCIVAAVWGDRFIDAS